MTADVFENIMARNNTTLSVTHKGDHHKSAVASLKLSNTNRKNAVLVASFCLVLCFGLLPYADAASVHKRAIVQSPEMINNTFPTKMCHQNTPCGWAIYIPFTRRIDYFMKNTCDCPVDLACLKTDDDLSVNAYVYRCKTRPASSSTESASATMNKT